VPLRIGTIVSRRTRSAAVHRVGPPLEDVLADSEEREQLRLWILPLLTIEANALAPAWRTRLHFVYSEYPELSFEVCDGRYRLVDGAREVERWFVRHGYDPLPEPRWKGSSVRFTRSAADHEPTGGIVLGEPAAFLREHRIDRPRDRRGSEMALVGVTEAAALERNGPPGFVLLYYSHRDRLAVNLSVTG
jgi:hypothetical protein